MRPHHRFWLVTTAVAMLLLAIAFPTNAQQPERTTISLATLAPAGSTWMRVFEAWNREIRRRSNQTLQFRIYAGGVQGDEAEVIRKMRNGRLDAASVTAVGLGQIHRPALVFQLPGILSTYEQLDRARDGLKAEMDRGFTEAGFNMLGWADVGQSRVFSTAPIRRPADFAGRHPWVWRDDVVLPELYRMIRTNPVPLQLPEVLGAIETGRVDTVITPPYAAIALQWSNRLTHMTDAPLSIVIGGTVISRRKWDSLTEEQRTILTETGIQFHQLARRNLRRDEQAALRTLRERGTTFVPVTEAQRREWTDIARRVRERLAGQIADAELVARVQAYGR